MPREADRDMQARRRQRIRRSTTWLGSALLLHIAIAAATVTLAVSPTGGLSAWTYGAIAAVIAAPVLLFLRERVRSSRGRPALWPGRAFIPAVLQGLALGVAGAMHVAGASQLLPAIGALVAAALQILCAVMAGRSLVRPYSSDVGELDVEVVTKIRQNRTLDVPLLAPDDVTLRCGDLLLTVRPGIKSKYVQRLALATVSEIEVRQATPADSPWYVLEDGREYTAPPGEVVVIHRRSGKSVVLPVFDPRGFAEVLRTRVRRARRDDGSTRTQPPRTSATP
jgi:hypothetical protein